MSIPRNDGSVSDDHLISDHSYYFKDVMARNNAEIEELTIDYNCLRYMSFLLSDQIKI